jgi:hypothetical protein
MVMKNQAAGAEALVQRHSAPLWVTLSVAA